MRRKSTLVHRAFRRIKQRSSIVVGNCIVEYGTCEEENNMCASIVSENNTKPVRRKSTLVHRSFQKIPPALWARGGLEVVSIKSIKPSPYPLPGPPIRPVWKTRGRTSLSPNDINYQARASNSARLLHPPPIRPTLPRPPHRPPTFPPPARRPHTLP